MGWWRCEHGTIGDGPADILENALKKIELQYRDAAGRPPTQGELANLIEFCTCGALVPECGDPKHPFSRATCGDKNIPRARSRGRQGVGGPFSHPEPGMMANVDPATLQHVPAAHAEELIQSEIEEAQRQNAERTERVEEPGDQGGPGEGKS